MLFHVLVDPVPVNILAQGPVSEGSLAWYYDPMNQTTQPMITKVPTRAPKRGAGEVCCGKGRSGSMTKAGGLGKEMVANLSKVQRAYAAQVKADRRAAALERREAEVAADNARVAELYN